MGQILVRNLDDDIIKSAKLKAKASGKSLEQYLRDLITESLHPKWDKTFAKIDELFEEQESYTLKRSAEDLIREDRDRE